MNFLILLLLVGVVAVFCESESNFTSALGLRAGTYGASLGVCGYEATCSVNGYSGACVSISAGCCNGGVATSGLCPGSSDIRCCTQAPCATPMGAGTCMQTSLCGSQGGTSVSGFCAGPSDLQCCVKSEIVSCSTPYGPGYCMATSQCASMGGSSVAGYCPGGADNQCCVQGGTSASYGVDISTTVTSSAASCFKSSGFSFVIPRGYQSIGTVDSQVCTSLTNAYNNGIGTRDVYIFPCPTCSKSASTQMGELVSYLRSNCATQWSGRVWLDIEGSQYWLGDYTANQNFYKQLRDSCTAYGIRCGVYSSYYMWQSLFGSTSFVYGNDLPLWYAHYDNNPSFSDFTPFAGWNSPHAKQYAGDVGACGMNVDKNFAPNGF